MPPFGEQPALCEMLAVAAHNARMSDPATIVDLYAKDRSLCPRMATWPSAASEADASADHRAQRFGPMLAPSAALGQGMRP